MTAATQREPKRYASPGAVRGQGESRQIDRGDARSAEVVMTANKYKCYCAGCAVEVAAGEGVYDGNVWCEEPKQGYDFGFNDPTTACRRYHEREERARVAADARRVEYEASPEYAALRAEAEEKSRARADVERALNARGLKTCNRCGGAGRSDLWHATGYTCFDCEGRGSVPMSERELRKAKKNAVATA